MGVFNAVRTATMTASAFGAMPVTQLGPPLRMNPPAPPASAPSPGTPSLLPLFAAAIVALAVVWCGAARWAESPASTPSSTLSQDGQIQPAQRPLFQRTLNIQRVQEPGIDEARMATAFNDLVAAVGTAVARCPDRESRIAALNRLLLTERQVTYLSNQYWRDSSLAASLLRRQGNCLATSTLYVLIGDALGFPIHMVVVPGHAFVRWDDGEVQRNIETTAKGCEISDDEYLYQHHHCDPADVTALGWGTSLDDDGFIAELVECAVRHRFGEGRLDEAIALQDQVEKLVPWRSDLQLLHIQLRSDQSKDRGAARAAFQQILTRDPPPSVATGALLALAHDAAGGGDIARQHDLLMRALQRCPKSSLEGVLTELAFCLRSLRDFHGARRYMELAADLAPPGSSDQASELYNLAILEKNDHDIDTALATLAHALAINPESWNVQMLEAGYLVLSGRRAEGLAKRARIAEPHADREFWMCMQTWFLAVCGERERFYVSFAETLAAANSQSVLIWIEQDTDLDPYRTEPTFQRLLATHRARLGSATEKAPPVAPAASAPSARVPGSKPDAVPGSRSQ